MENRVILVADDDKAIREIVASTLSLELSARVVLASDGERLLALARQLRPVLVVTDVRMPGLSGLDVARELAADPRTSGIPVLAVTAVASRDECLAAGCCEYLAKPFELAKLVEVARACLDWRGDRGAPAGSPAAT